MSGLEINEETTERSLELLNISKKLVYASATGLTKEKLLDILNELDCKIRSFMSFTSGEERDRIEEVVDRFEALLKRLEATTALLPVDPDKVKEFYKIITGEPHDGIVCLECGEIYKTLRVHLRKAHLLTPTAYRKKHGLDPKAPLVCKSLQKRGANGKENG